MGGITPSPGEVLNEEKTSLGYSYCRVTKMRGVEKMVLDKALMKARVRNLL